MHFGGSCLVSKFIMVMSREKKNKLRQIAVRDFGLGRTYGGNKNTAKLTVVLPRFISVAFYNIPLDRRRRVKTSLSSFLATSSDDEDRK